MNYTVEVIRENNIWIADVLNLPGAHTDATNLAALHRRVQEVIGLVLDLPENQTVTVTYTYKGIDEDLAAAITLGNERAKNIEREKQLAIQTAETIATLANQGWSVRDVSGALHMSPGRVSQIHAKQ